MRRLDRRNLGPRALPAALVLGAVLGLAAVAAVIAPGCKLVEKTSDALADATAGTAAEGVFRGTARAAESFQDYSPAQEYYIGRAVAAEILSRYKVHSDRKLQDYVNLVGKVLLAAPETAKPFNGFRFIVLEGDELQAVSTPGGFVFITAGTVRRAKDEDELAAVLAHEIAHVTLKHGVGAIKGATRKKSLALLAQGAGQIAVEATGSGGGQDARQIAELSSLLGSAVQDITSDLLVKGYSRDTEIEADKAAVKYLQSSGYSRGALTSYLAGIEKERAGGKGGWFATHPSPEERMEEIADAGAATGAAAGREARKGRFQAIAGGG